MLKKLKTLCLLATLTAGTQAYAAVPLTMPDIQGNWNASAAVAFTVTDLMTLNYPAQMTCALTASTVKHGDFACNQAGFGNVISGDLNMLSNGNLVAWNLGLPGLDLLEGAMTNTLAYALAQQNVSFDPASAEYDIRTILVTPFPAVNGAPTSGSLTVKGFVRAKVAGRWVKKGLSYKANVTFGNRLP